MTSLTSFELFPSLPGELRNEIFAAAIQPRIVRIDKRLQGNTARDIEKYEALIQLTHKKIAEMDKSAMDDPPKTYTEILAAMLGPDCKPEFMLDYFRSQETGFKASRTQFETRTPVYKHFPEGVEWCLLDRYGATAMSRAMRTFHFWSSSPIPALLHTCRESRRAMQLCGYELVFAINDKVTPRIWFNFAHDTLHLGCLFSTDVRQLRSKDLMRVSRVAIHGHQEAYVQLIPEILSVAVQLKEVLWIVHQFDNLGLRKKHHYVETESNLRGYIECDSPEFVNHNLVKYDRIDAWPAYAEKLLAYQRQNEGGIDGFWPLQNAELESRFRMQRDKCSGSWDIPKWKHVFIVTKEQAGDILAFRRKTVEDMRAVERLENEEGPRRVSYYPFDDDCDVLDELREENDRFRYYY